MGGVRSAAREYMNLAPRLQDQVGGREFRHDIENNDKFVRGSDLHAELRQLDPGAQIDLVQDLVQTRVGHLAALIGAEPDQPVESLARYPPFEQAQPQLLQPGENVLAPLPRPAAALVGDVLQLDQRLERRRCRSRPRILATLDVEQPRKLASLAGLGLIGAPDVGGPRLPGGIDFHSPLKRPTNDISLSELGLQLIKLSCRNRSCRSATASGDTIIPAFQPVLAAMTGPGKICRVAAPRPALALLAGARTHRNPGLYRPRPWHGIRTKGEQTGARRPDQAIGLNRNDLSSPQLQQ